MLSSKAQLSNLSRGFWLLILASQVFTAPPRFVSSADFIRKLSIPASTSSIKNVKQHQLRIDPSETLLETSCLSDISPFIVVVVVQVIIHPPDSAHNSVQPTFLQFTFENVMLDCVKSFTSVQVDDGPLHFLPSTKLLTLPFMTLQWLWDVHSQFLQLPMKFVRCCCLKSMLICWQLFDVLVTDYDLQLFHFFILILLALRSVDFCAWRNQTKSISNYGQNMQGMEDPGCLNAQTVRAWVAKYIVLEIKTSSSVSWAKIFFGQSFFLCIKWSVKIMYFFHRKLSRTHWFDLVWSGFLGDIHNKDLSPSWNVLYASFFLKTCTFSKLAIEKFRGLFPHPPPSVLLLNITAWMMSQGILSSLMSHSLFSSWKNYRAANRKGKLALLLLWYVAKIREVLKMYTVKKGRSRENNRATKWLSSYCFLMGEPKEE